jgi:hypothetical protein
MGNGFQTKMCKLHNLSPNLGSNCTRPADKQANISSYLLDTNLRANMPNLLVLPTVFLWTKILPSRSELTTYVLSNLRWIKIIKVRLLLLT